MDFNTFDSCAAGDKGAWLHLRNPRNGELIYADPGENKLPCRVKVLGIEGETGQTLVDQHRKEMRKPVEKKADDQVSITDEEHEALIKRNSPLITDFENINRGDRLAKAPEDVHWFLGLQRVVGGDFKTFMEQVQEFSLRRDNFLGNASGS